MATIIQLECSVQNYLWGKCAKESLVAKFANASNNDNERYAELWMGTHKKGPSVVASESLKLTEWIRASPETRLGPNARFISGNDSELPFLFKVLSVDKALSIQVHPNKSHAEELHQKDPAHYPDANHKPELAIALTEFEAFCGFRPISEIISILSNHPEICSLLSQDLKLIVSGGEVNNEKAFIKAILEIFFSQENLSEIIYKELNAKTDLSPDDKLFLRIYNQHPNDRGLPVVFLLNHITLQPGEAVFLGANKIHAYFRGDCIECMACSDNVVRAGLTPKFMDVDTLVSMLDYTPTSKEEQVMVPQTHGPITSYLPPVRDFGVERIAVGGNEVIIPAKPSPQIVICTEGNGTVANGDSQVPMGPGTVVYIIPGVQVTATGQAVLFSSFCQAE